MPALNYQWRFNDANIAGATNNWITVHPQVDGDFAGLPLDGLAELGSCNANV